MHSFMIDYTHNIVKNFIFQRNKINIDLQKNNNI